MYNIIILLCQKIDYLTAMRECRPAKGTADIDWRGISWFIRALESSICSTSISSSVFSGSYPYWRRSDKFLATVYKQHIKQSNNFTDLFGWRNGTKLWLQFCRLDSRPLCAGRWCAACPRCEPWCAVWRDSDPRTSHQSDSALPQSPAAAAHSQENLSGSEVQIHFVSECWWQFCQNLKYISSLLRESK